MISTSSKSLNSQISFNHCNGLNIAGTESIKEAFGFGGCIISNKGDPEVIIFIKFKDNVNLSGILIESSMDDSKVPTTMSLFANKESLDFGDIGSVASTEAMALEGKLGKLIPLKIAKFKSLSKLYIYLNNPDADQIQINNIQFYGTDSEKMEFSQIKNQNVG